MNKFVFMVLVLCLALVKAVDFQNQQSTLTDSIIAPKGLHIVLKFRVITSDKPAKLFWNGEGVEIEFHDIHGNLVKVVPPRSDVEIHAHITVLDNGSFEIYTDNGILLKENT
jgi:hypothetical protein